MVLNKLLKILLKNGLLIIVKKQKKELVNIIEKANELNKSDYTEDSWNKFSDALESAIQINKNVDAKQYEVDSIVEELEKTMNQLIKNDGESNPDVTDENLPLDKEVISSSDEYITDEDLDSTLGSDWINNMDNNPEMYMQIQKMYIMKNLEIYGGNIII